MSEAPRFAVEFVIVFRTEEEADDALQVAQHAVETGQDLVVSAGSALAAEGTPIEWRAV